MLTVLTIFIGYFLVFLKQKSIVPQDTVASLPSFTYDVVNLWLLLFVISKLAYKTALYSVDDSWQIPPPIPGTTFPPEYIVASLYPFAIVLSPTILL